MRYLKNDFEENKTYNFKDLQLLDVDFHREMNSMDIMHLVDAQLQADGLQVSPYVTPMMEQGDFDVIKASKKFMERKQLVAGKVHNRVLEYAKLCEALDD